MTIPPKARRYHASPAEAVRLPDETGGVNPNHDEDLQRLMRTDPADDGFGVPGQPQPGDGDADLANQLQAIRDEQLTERHLRLAGRIAALHLIKFASEEEAVLRLRQRGIDPTHRDSLGQILAREGNRAQSAPSPTAPAVMRRPGEVARPPEPLTEAGRASEIFRIQRDIAARRRRRLMMLGLRLLVFVLLPSLLAAVYYLRIATPLYATVSQFQIQRADSGGSPAAGGLLGGSQLATNPDSVAVQSYLSSRDAMLRLDADHGFKAAYQGPDIDPLKRLAANATGEETYRLYQKSVKIGYDPTEGMIDMEVIAPDPQQSQAFSLALIQYAEEQVDRMSSRMRADQMSGAEASYRDAENKVLAAQRRVQELQQELGVLDPAAEGSVVMNQIAGLEGQLSEKQLELGKLLANPQPLQSRVVATQGDIRRLEQMIADTRLQLTQGNAQRNSLAAISGELRIAESDLTTRQELLASAAAQMEAARIEANKQVRYLSLSVAPIPPDEPTYPKALQNSLVAFLLFSAIYLMLSLTVSILREQVST
jgi:capsular polysaccharide transport system permease protein